MDPIESFEHIKNYIPHPQVKIPEPREIGDLRSTGTLLLQLKGFHQDDVLQVVDEDA